MAGTKVYESKVVPDIPNLPQSTADQFGAGVGQSLQEFGRSNFALAEGQQAVGRGFMNLASSANEIADRMYKQQVEDEVTNSHKWAIDTRSKWQQKLIEMENSTQPGDTTFVQRVQDAMKSEFEDYQKTVTTKVANDKLDVLYGNLRNELGMEAISIQSKLQGQNIKNQDNDMTTNLSALVGNDPSKLESSIAQYRAAVMDENSTYKNTSLPVREQLIREGTEKLKFAAAQGFIRNNPSAATSLLGNGPERDAIREAASNPPTPGMPVDMKAEGLKPYTREKLSALSDKIDMPSRYDDDFKSAAKLYGLDWRELKLRAVTESGLQNAPVNSAGAMGVMQITGDTAKTWGVSNPMDPHEAIFGAARAIAKYKTQAQGDMAKVDMMYHGGANGEETANWGPKTKQYASNLSALRQTAGIISTSNPESIDGPDGPIDLQHKAAIDSKVGNKIPGYSDLPWNMQQSLWVYAEHRERSADAQATRAQAQQARIQKDVQDSNMNSLVKRILNPDANGGYPTMDDIEKTDLESSQRMTITNFMTQREASKNRADKDHPDKMVDFIQRIESPPGTDKRINSTQEIYDAFAKGDLSEAEVLRLEARLNKRKEGGTTTTKKLNQAFSLAHSAFAYDFDATEAADYTNRWSDTVEKLIARDEANNVDPMHLFNPKDKEYVLSRDFIRSFSDPPEMQLQKGAAKINEQINAMSTQRPAEKGLELNKEYTVNGKPAKYLGGPKTALKSWLFASDKSASGGE